MKWILKFLQFWNSWEDSLDLVQQGNDPILSYNDHTEPIPVEPTLITKTTPMPENQLYLQAKASLHRHMTLNDAVPAHVGCAEAVSAVLKLIGVTDAPQGIAGTAALDAWLAGDSRFLKIDAPEAGAIIMSPTGQGNGVIEGHTGIFGEFDVAFPNDYGIMSNDSATGYFLEQWSLARWKAYYVVTGGLPINIYRFIG